MVQLVAVNVVILSDKTASESDERLYEHKIHVVGQFCQASVCCCDTKIV